MINKDLSSLLHANSIIIDSSAKEGKMTFLLYLVNFFYKERVIIFTPQEKYLFDRRISALETKFLQFNQLSNVLTPYYLDENFTVLKQKYGYDFFLKELIQIIVTSEEKIIVIHRLGDYFEFQDRYEIENIYKNLTKIAAEHQKKMIFLVNNQHENYTYIHRIAEEFTDVSISLKSNDKNERILDIKDVLHNVEHPPMHFRVHENNFILDIYSKESKTPANTMKNVLITEINKTHDNMKEILTYIFDKPDFSVKYADSLQSILQEVFISPEIIIVLMDRREENFEIIASIKKQLPDTSIIGILDQDFVRTEDIQKAYNFGCNELFANNLSLEKLILSIQRASNSLFYTQSLDSLPKFDNIMTNLEDFKTLAYACIKRSLFFSLFTLERKDGFEKIANTSRNYDFIFQEKNKIYYMAISTIPKDIQKIIEQFKKTYEDIELTCIWEPINHDSFDECIS